MRSARAHLVILSGLAVTAAILLPTHIAGAQRSLSGRAGVRPLSAIATAGAVAPRLGTTGAGATRGAPRAPEARKFVAGDWYLSPRVWLGGVEEDAKAFGVSVERAIKAPDDEGDGVWALGASFDRYSYTFAGIIDVSVIPIAAMLTYHVALDNPRIDPYVGAGLGYYIVSASADGVDAVSQSTTFFQSQLGVRYFLTDVVAVGAHIGTGIGSMAVSATLRF